MVKHNVEYHLSLARAGIAQQVEQLTCNQQVVGSSPIASSKIWRGSRVAKGIRLSICRVSLRWFESNPLHQLSSRGGAVGSSSGS